MNPMIEKYLGSIIRSAIAAGLGALGLFSDSDVEKWAAIVSGFLIAAALSAWEKYRSRQKLVTAMAMPKRASEEQIKTVIADGQAPSVSTPASVVPVLATATTAPGA